jgi:hypothetical protein
MLADSDAMLSAQAQILRLRWRLAAVSADRRG